MKLDEILSSMDVSEETTREVLAKAPELKPLLTRFARKALKGQPVPRSFTGDAYSYETQQLLEHLLHTVTGRTADGKVYGTILDFMRAPSHWRGVIKALGLETESTSKDPVAEFFTRLSWRYPMFKGDLEILASFTPVRNFLRTDEGRKKWETLFVGAIGFFPIADGSRMPTTLSQLGSDWFNDSKSLRSGSLREQLLMILSVLGNLPTSDERTLLETFRIYDNPYTRSVVCFAPFTFTTREGKFFDFPLRLFEAGLACQLPVQTVTEIESIQWEGVGKKIVTSENAAPLVRFVEGKTPVVYTEGYPNAAVMKLLSLFAKSGLSAIHYGDADPDGFAIAFHLGHVIPLARTVADEIVKNPGELKGIPLTDQQRTDLADALNEPGCSWPYLEAFKILQESGCWYEQEAFPL